MQCNNRKTICQVLLCQIRPLMMLVTRPLTAAAAAAASDSQK